jgi:elongation factor P--(R)-beta-lysine ligase
MFQEFKTHIEILQDRAAMFKSVRLFFDERGVLEVDTPILSKSAPIDAHIDILETQASFNQKGYLHSSPEYGMKKLLAKGVGDIFQLSHVYRQGELSSRHQIEFTMIEWYRKDFSFSKLLEETKELIFLFLGELPYELLHYETLLQRVHHIDPFTTPVKDLSDLCKNHGLDINSDDRDVYLSFLWDIAEQSLGDNKLSFITHFPASQAALSKTFEEKGKSYASRFECYYQGMELANGYHELTDPIEQKKRLLEQNKKRLSLDKTPLPIDEGFLNALNILSHENYFGVAVGFDRLMMLRHHADNITDILPLGWDEL